MSQKRETLWQKISREINWNPTDRQLRQFGGTAAVALPTISAIHWWVSGRGSVQATILAASVGITLAIIGWFLPRSLKPLFLGLSILSTPIGMVVSVVAMIAIYLAVFLPIGLIFRLMKRDRLQLKFDRAAVSYWQPKRQPQGAKSYYRQS